MERTTSEGSTDPESHLAGANRVETCRKCHSNAVANFAKFDPHASHKDATGYPFLHGAYIWLEKIIYILVGLFALHMLFWFTRSFFFARRHGRDRPCVAESRAITSFVKLDRVIYVILIMSFIGLVVTGLPLKYGTYPWARRLAGYVGGFQTTSIFHRSFAMLLFGGVCHAPGVAGDLCPSTAQGGSRLEGAAVGTGFTRFPMAAMSATSCG